MNYTPYHIHSHYSLLDSASKPEEYLAQAAEWGMKSFAFSEHGNVKGWMKKRRLCLKYGLQYIHATECYLTRDLLQNTEDGLKKVRDNYHTILIAKDDEGLRELNSLLSMASDKDHFFYVPRISFQEFVSISDHIISTSACLTSPLNKLELNDPWYERLVNAYTYLEIQPHNSDDQAAYNVHLASLAQKYHKPLILGTDAHSVSPYKNECRDILLDFKHQYYAGEDDFDMVFHPFDDICDMLTLQDALPEGLWREALENTNRLADRIEDYTIDSGHKYPILYGSPEKDEEVFRKNVWDSLDQKLKAGIIKPEQEQSYREALTEELDTFSKLGMPGFMEFTSEMCRWCHENGIMTGPGRGSVSGSRAAFVTDITDVDADRWQTIFSRFCNSERVSLGDIDTDIIESDRPKIFKYLIERFGESKTARVPSYGTIQGKKGIAIIYGALKERWKREHPDSSDDVNPYRDTVMKAAKLEYESDEDLFRKNHKDIAYYLDGLIGVFESQSVHPAGIVVSPITLPDNYCVFTKDDATVLSIDMDEIHDEAQLVKVDLLILRNIAIIKDTCTLAGIPYPKSHMIDWDDQEVWKDMLISRVGIFQFETEGSFHMMKEFAPTSIPEMALMTAAIRPAGASYRSELIKRHVHKNPTELIDTIFKDSFGFPVFQEDITRFLEVACGFSGASADTVRRGIADKDIKKLEAILPQIVDGYCSRSDKPRAEAEAEVTEFIQVLRDASSYAFNYGHAVSYSMVSYLCAYLRKYYTYEFIVSLLNNAANEDDIANAKALASQLGIKILPPKYGISSATYEFNRETKEISKGAADIKYVGAKVATGLYKMAHDGKPRTFVDVILDSTNGIRDMNKRRMDALIAVGYFSDFGNISELSRIYSMVEEFKFGDTKSYKCDKVGERLRFIEKYASNLKKDGTPGSSYKFESKDAVIAFLREAEQVILSLGIPDVSFKVKAENQQEYLGYIDLVTGREEDRRKLYIMDYYEIMNKWGGKGVWKVRIKTRSIGSGKEATLSLSPVLVQRNPIEKGSVIEVKEEWLSLDKGQYWVLYKYNVIE